MSQIFKNSVFWKKFTRFLILGLSIFVILAAFKVGESSQVGAIDYSCPTNTGSASFTSPINNQSLSFGTSSVNVSWNAAPYANTYSVTATNTTTGVVIYSNADFPGTSFSLSPLVNGNYYRVLILPRNNCGSGASSEVAFSVGTTATSCTNQPVFCPENNDEGGGSYVYPDPSNNCQIPLCPGGSSGQLSCSISATLQQNSTNNYILTGQPSNFSAYNWDLNGDNFRSYNDASGQVVYRSFSNETNIYLRVQDQSNNVGACSTTVYPQSSDNQTQSPTCSISASSSTPSNGEFVNLTASAQAYGNKSISEYRWDLDGDGSYGDAGGSQTGRNYYQDTTVRLEVVDSQGYRGQCNRFLNVSGTSCRSLTCPSAPAGCSYTGQLTYSCSSTAILTCGTLTGNCTGTSTTVTVGTPAFGNGITITNTNTSSSSSSSSNNNNNNINIK